MSQKTSAKTRILPTALMLSKCSILKKKQKQKQNKKEKPVGLNNKRM